MSERPDKQRVAAAFSQAAPHYDSVASLQRLVGHELLQRLPANLAVQHWLDLGSGTGYFSRQLAERFPSATGIALDLAEGMLRHAALQTGANWFIAGDAESLPLQGQSVELIFSSLALQWCGNFAGVLAEAWRVLRPGGLLAFSSLSQGTLQELRQSWLAVDDFTHVNAFRHLTDYQQLCEQSGLQVLCLECCPHVLFFPDLRQLTHELKALGAGNHNAGRAPGLTSRAKRQALVDAYEAYRQAAGLPATYQVIYGLLRKEP